MLANYAHRAIAQIRQDTLASYKFVERIGDKDFTLSPPLNAAQWARGIFQWYQPCNKIDHLTPTLDTTKYGTTVKSFIVEANRWNGNWSEGVSSIVPVANIFTEEEDDGCSLGGMRKDSSLFQLGSDSQTG